MRKRQFHLAYSIILYSFSCTCQLSTKISPTPFDDHLNALKINKIVISEDDFYFSVYFF